MGSVRKRSSITKMDEQQQHQEVDDCDDDASACESRFTSGSSRKPSSLDVMAAVFRQNGSSSSSVNSSTPKTEQALFSSLRDVAIQKQVDEDEGSSIVLRQMLRSWILGIMLPMSIVAWHVTDHSWSATLGAALFMPTFAIVQGAIGILTYRLYYGDAPIPLSPSHGVVVAVAASTAVSSASGVSALKNNSSSIQQRHQQTRGSSGGCECCAVPSNSFYSSSELSKEFLQRQQEQAVLYQQQHQQQPVEASTPLQQHQQQQTEPPLRLLVIGDSLAIGAGQQNSCTPVMPEIIAKTLSQKMGGRVVYWTSHGQTGASAAMLVRELERGQSAAAAAMADLDNSMRSTLSMDENDLEITTRRSSSLYLSPPKAAVALVAAATAAAPRSSSSSSCCSDTDDSSSEDEYSSSEFNTNTSVPVRARTCSDNTSNRRSTGRRLILNRTTPRTAASTTPLRGGGGEEEKDYHTFKTTFDTNATSTTSSEEEMAAASSSSSMTTWRDLLQQHRKLFEHPEYMGPYDIAVVLTGPNDLKGAVFPFLLHGEDKEFQQQAQERGGSYRLELRRLLDTLNRKMQWGSFQQFVSAAKVSMREKMEETMERIITTTTSSSSLTTTTTTANGATTMASLDTVPQTNDAQNQHDDIPSQRIFEDEHQQTANTGNKEHVPLIVLPGMPARALPLFQHVPLRWLAVPATDMMDMHKRHLAKSHPDEVLFVNAPTERELGSYVENMTTEMGDGSSSSCNEETVLLALRDVKRRDCRRARGAMQSYYAKKTLGQKSTCSAYMNNPFKLIRTHLLGFPPASHLKAFSPDGVHPNDMGYEFWGRHIANAIYDKCMTKREESNNVKNNGS